MDGSLNDAKRSAVALALVALVAAPAGLAVVGATPAWNVFLNAEFEACAPAPVGVVVGPTSVPLYGPIMPETAQFQSTCAPWLLKTQEPGDKGRVPHSEMRTLSFDGHGGTTSARIRYVSDDGLVLFGQNTGLNGTLPATPWRAVQQVTFDARASGPVDLGFRADAVRPDGVRFTALADQGTLSLPGTGTWARHTFTLTALVDEDGKRSAFTGLWFEVQPTTSNHALLDIDNVYVTNVYLQPYPGR